MLDLTGQRFGMLVALERVHISEKNTGWLCQCDCGQTWMGPTNVLRFGNTASCGCRRGGATHGHMRGGEKSPTYSSWKAMISRCYHSSSPSYEHYQKLGITVCDRWRYGEGEKTAFECFLDDMGERTSKDLTLDRHPNNDGNYEPGNCRWASKRDQANNRRTNKLFEHQGRTMTFAQLVRATGLEKELLRHRLLRAGWTVEEALNAPKQQGRRKGTERPRIS